LDGEGEDGYIIREAKCRARSTLTLVENKAWYVAGYSERRTCCTVAAMMRSCITPTLEQSYALYLCRLA
jgi:hypothetical protein